jgi:hypothetical protein
LAFFESLLREFFCVTRFSRFDATFVSSAWRADRAFWHLRRFISETYKVNLIGLQKAQLKLALDRGVADGSLKKNKASYMLLPAARKAAAKAASGGAAAKKTRASPAKKAAAAKKTAVRSFRCVSNVRKIINF